MNKIKSVAEINTTQNLAIYWRKLQKLSIVLNNNILNNIAIEATNYFGYSKDEVLYVRNNHSDDWTIKVNIPGLIGVKGVLPRVMSLAPLYFKQTMGERVLLDFLHCFHHRYFSLWCRAEIKYDWSALREHETFKNNNDKLSKMLCYLAGSLNDNNIKNKSFIQYAPLRFNKSKHLSTLKTCLEHEFLLSFDINYSSPEYSRIDEQSLTQIGKIKKQNRLGQDALLGNHGLIWGNKIQLILLADNFTTYEKWRQTPALIERVLQIVVWYFGKMPTLIFKIRISTAMLSPVLLAQQSTNLHRLGLNCCLITKKSPCKLIDIPIKGKDTP